MTVPTTTRADLQPGTSGARAEHEAFSLKLRLFGDYAQIVDFGMPDVVVTAIDEPPPLGRGFGPNPARLLAASVGACLGASLLYCLRKAHVEVADLTTTVTGSLIRNERGRLRIGTLHVTVTPAVPAETRERIARCLALFEDYCVVTGSVREGIDVQVEVQPVTRDGRCVATSSSS